MDHNTSGLVHSTVVANRFWDLAASQSSFLTQMQLQKLVYFAHGWHLAIYDFALTTDKPEAWDYGPLYKELWFATRKYGNSFVIEKVKKSDLLAISPQYINDISSDSDGYCHAILNIENEKLIQKVFEVYGKLKAFQLSALTHQRGTPWHTIFVDQELKKTIIPQQLIKAHFASIAGEEQ